MKKLKINYQTKVTKLTTFSFETSIAGGCSENE